MKMPDKIEKVPPPTFISVSFFQPFSFRPQTHLSLFPKILEMSFKKNTLWGLIKSSKFYGFSIFGSGGYSAPPIICRQNNFVDNIYRIGGFFPRLKAMDFCFL